MMAVSPETQGSRLVRIRDGGDRDSWSQFVAIYAPLIYGFLRKRGLQDADAADITQEVMDYERQLFRHAADRVRGRFHDSTWQAFWSTAVEGRPVKEVAGKLQLSVAAVHLAKGRVIRRIKREIALLDGVST